MNVLDAYASSHGGLAVQSPVDIVFSEHDVLQPDVAYFSAPRAAALHLRRPVRIAPDLVVEVRSPSTESTDRGRKVQTFERFGVPEYWIVDPEAPLSKCCG
jgi:Uma2 family endonuclease